MNKKKISICSIALIFLLAFLWGIHCVYDNYRFGQELYQAVNKMSTQSRALVDGICFLQEEVETAGNDYDDVNRQGFDSAIASVQSGFGCEDIPILNDARLEYIDRFEKLYIQTANDSNNSKLTELFTDHAKVSEIAVLKEQLNNMTECFVDFSEKYNQMSFVEKCFTPWENERRILTEKVRIP